MEIVRTIAELRTGLAPWKAAGEPVGLVPTMGALHPGHMALVAAARQDCRRVVVSIFVNPKQFGPTEDLAAYPRHEEADLEMLRATGVDLAFAPSVAEIYPLGFATSVRVGGLGDGLCGAHRHGHFDGVATVVAKLLLQSLPTAAYFGEKDYQQLLIVRRLAQDLDIPARIEAVPTVREPDGLALSSRNRYLSAAERRIAPHLAETLRSIATALAAGPGAVAEELARGREALARAGFALDYLEVRDARTLAPIETAIAAPARVFGAVHLGRTRLIDNIPIAAPAVLA